MQQRIGKQSKLGGRSWAAWALSMALVCGGVVLVTALFVRPHVVAPVVAPDRPLTLRPCGTATATATATPSVGFLYLYTVSSGDGGAIVGGGIAAAPATGDCQIWHAAIGESSCAPIITDDVVYTCTFTHGLRIVAVRVADGQVLWTTPAFPLPPGGVDPELTADATTVVVSSAQDGLYALDAHSGSIRWHQAIEGNGPPALRGGVVYQQVQNALQDQAIPRLYSAFRATDGTPLWAIPDAMNPNIGNVLNATAAFGDTASGQAVALDLRDGHVLWTGQHGFPIAATDTTVFVIDNFMLAALSATDGTLLWRSSVKTGFDGLSIVNGVLYVLSDIGAPEELAAVRAGDGTVLWQVALPPAYDKPPVVRDGVVYLYYTTRDSIGACCYPHIAAYNAMTGAQRWLKSAPDVGGIIQSVASS